MHEMDFDLWMRKFNRLCVNRCGFSTEDLPDWNFFDEWESGSSVEEAFDEFWSELREEF